MIRVALPVARASKDLKPLVRATNRLVRKTPEPTSARAELAKIAARTQPETAGRRR